MNASYPFKKQIMNKKCIGVDEVFEPGSTKIINFKLNIMC